MEANQKKILKAISLEIRHILEGRYEDDKLIPGDLERRLNEIGVWRDRPSKPLEELPHLSQQDKESRKVVDAYIKYREETGVKKEEAVAEFVRESAYTWANRLLALRCMESRGIIDEVIVQKEVYGSRSLVHNRFARKNPEACAGEDDGIYYVLFDEFTARSKELPDIFNPNAPAILIRPSVAALKRIIDLLSGKVTIQGQEKASDELFVSHDTLGWAYQYWNSEEKDRIFEKVRTNKGLKIEGMNIIPATQLYTEPYMVKFLVQNSLGAMWISMHPDSKLPEKWEYYLKNCDRPHINYKSIKEVTFFDPACGSGHFLVEAFDLYFEMYLEEFRDKTPESICNDILNYNLFGIDIDERAAHITRLSLWMKAKEKTMVFTFNGDEAFHNHIIATNIHLPKDKNHLENFLLKYPEDTPLKSAIESVFEGLENAHEIGSLIQIDDPVEKELKYIANNAKQRRFDIATGTIASDYDYAKWKKAILDRLVDHFNNEAENPDLSQAYFSDSIGKGLLLFKLLNNKYDVVAANPPYMGSKNMGDTLKRYIFKFYPEGKRDIYSAFIIQCLRLVNETGRLAMVTQHSWMFLRSFKDLRIPKNCSGQQNKYQGLLRYNIESLVHLGEHAFNESAAAGAFVVLFILSNSRPEKNHKIVALRLVGQKNPEEKDNVLRASIDSSIENITYLPLQLDFNEIYESPIIYWMDSKFLHILSTSEKLTKYAKTLEGLNTTNNNRFLREFYEIIEYDGWVTYSKGGGYSKWFGLTNLLVRWDSNGERIKTYVTQKSGDHWSRRVSGVEGYFKKGLGYSLLSRGSIGVRILDSNGIFDVGTVAIFPNSEDLSPIIGGILNTHIMQYFIRGIVQGLQVHAGYLDNVPIKIPNEKKQLTECVNYCTSLKALLLSQYITERNYNCITEDGSSIKEKCRNIFNKRNIFSAYLLSCEYLINYYCNKAYCCDDRDELLIYTETGIPSGYYPLISGYDIFDKTYIKNMESPSELIEHIENSRRLIATPDQLDVLRKKLKKYYEDGSGKSIDNFDIDIGLNDTLENEDTINSQIPIPSETFLEELSRKLQIHPISIYWLLKEGIEKENWSCFSNEKQVAEDIFTVIILKLLGYKWPVEIKNNLPSIDWIDKDGIIPIVSIYSEKTLLERVRECIAVEFNVSNVQSIENEFKDIMGITLEEWIFSYFFENHISQFKKRPIAWQLSSKPITKFGKSNKQSPVFSCLIYYHKFDVDLLPKIRNQYVGPLINRYETELRTIESASALSGDQSARKVQLDNWIMELKDFDTKLSLVSEYGFSQLPISRWGKEEKNNIDSLKEILSKEPIDKWSSKDGIALNPSSVEEFYMQECRFDPDINDGVRVNIAPLQKVGLLAVDVLAKKDVDKAIADRAEWRADERRWCREGKLPRPGWWKEASK